MFNNQKINNQMVYSPNGAMNGSQDNLKLVSKESFNDVEIHQNTSALAK